MMHGGRLLNAASLRKSHYLASAITYDEQYTRLFRISARFFAEPPFFAAYFRDARQARHALSRARLAIASPAMYRR